MVEQQQEAQESVVVAVKVRPLVHYEEEQGCRTSLVVTPGDPHPQARAHYMAVYILDLCISR